MRTFHLTGLLTLLLVKASVAQAQRINPHPLSSFNAENSQRWVVKFAPLSLFDPSNTIQFGVERLLGQHQAVQIEFGYGPQNMNLWQTSQDTRYTDKEIWRGRAEWRYYWHGGPVGSYIALEGLYKQTNAYENGTIGMGCINGPCQYYQLFSSPIAKYVWAGHLKFGRQFSLLADNNRLLADFYGGLGIRGSSVKRSIQPDGFYYYQSGGYSLFNSFSSTPNALISISYGMKIGYSF